ncbi:neural cell adhesion molecule 1-like isoform X1 [Mercenaria mercenaria]|uniref:neural cell adhesion molecule 1-like isoform X1 n=1 Tax=Mercenaria mercenaria TaxID=6596 RepID=UPI00234ED488|nr:neural cell adhesion molecule 1-like isoform X1 [Mercenaria mercenaria]
MELLRILLPWIQTVVFIVSIMKTAEGAYDTIKKTKPCVLNHSCKLPCRLEPFRDVTVIWFDGKHEVLTQGMQVYKHTRNLKINKPARNEWELRILRVDLSFADTYWCKTRDGLTLSEITVVIEHAPRLKNKSSSTRTHFLENSLAQLNCEFSGIPEPKVTWYRGPSKERIEGLKDHKLIIRNVTRYASDEYACIAENRHGTSERHMHVFVDFAPEVAVMAPVVYFTGGEMVILGCAVQASPLQKAFWTNHKGIKIERNNWQYEVDDEKESEYFPVRFIQLEINKATIDDEGNYTCHGEDRAGRESRAVVALKIKRF